MLSLSVLALSLLGCGGGGTGAKDRPNVYPVSGKITYKGAPVDSADVTFICAEANRSAFGRTDSQGFFKLTTFSPNDGAVEGKHVITVTKIQAAGSTEQPSVEDAEYNPDEVARPTPAPAKNLIPQKYADAKTSDLFAVVSPEGNPEMNLELKD